MDMSRGHQGRCGRPNAVTDPSEVPSINCTSYRKWEVKSGIPLSSLWGLCQRVGARKHKRWVKPLLSNKQIAIGHMHRKGGTGVVADDMYNWVHVDEKWFYVMKDKRGIYLHPEEYAPKPPRAQNKQFITKVMLLTAVARPRMISDGVRFDGNIDMWPIADTVAATRSSKNCKKGTMMLKPAMVTADRYKELMIDKVIPAIKARMSVPPGHTIFVQQDGAKPHTDTGGGVMEAIQATAGDSTILETQPANSSDLNVNELGFFHSIKQLKEDVGVSSSEDLVEDTMGAFDVYPRKTLERVWQSLFAVLGEVLDCKGDNSYKLPHLGKENLGRAGKRPVNGRVDEEKYRVGK
ncbi:unnamed protein product, partial [Discosporangium mesarthrocarpum]